MNKTRKKAVLKKIAGWIGYFILLGTFLYAFAPSSWWQWGVTSAEDRNEIAAFSLRGIDSGAVWTFSEKRGKVLLVNYWATWCGPCRFETPGLVNISKNFAGSDFEIVGVTLDHDLTQVPAFLREYEITYPILLPGNDPNLGGSGMKLPTTFLYDKQGRLAKKYTGMVLESTLRSDIKSLLAEN